jgi:hypothetical protein
MVRWRTWLALGVIVACLGCGGGGEKGKNKDLDRPKPAEKAGEK